MRKVQTPRRVSLETSRRDLSDHAVFVVCPPPWLTKTNGLGDSSRVVFYLACYMILVQIQFGRFYLERLRQDVRKIASLLSSPRPHQTTLAQQHSIKYLTQQARLFSYRHLTPRPVPPLKCNRFSRRNLLTIARWKIRTGC